MILATTHTKAQLMKAGLCDRMVQFGDESASDFNAMRY